MRDLPLKLLLTIVGIYFLGSSFAQQAPTNEAREKLRKVYDEIKIHEITFEEFFELNAHLYHNPSASANRVESPVITNAVQDTYCSKVRPYCTNGDFETGLDQTQYTGAYGTWSTGLYPNPFSLTYGFLSGTLNLSTARQTIVNKSEGTDPTTSIPLVPPNGGSQSLRLGNRATGYGTELIAKTLTVEAAESILSFYYAVVFQDPGHTREDQPAFSVRVYDCATGLELPNVANLGNGSNTAVSDSRNPFFKTLNSSTYGTIAYRDWSSVQINLSQHIGKTVIIVFTNKDCGQGAHWGYTYIDNLFSDKCPVGPVDGTAGSIRLDTANTNTCAVGKVCATYSLPTAAATTGSVAISLDIYQNNALVKTLTSPTLTQGTSYCFDVDPATLGINTALGGFDYTLSGKFTISGFDLGTRIVGNPPGGQQPGSNNDYLVTCPPVNPNVYYSKSAGDLHNVLTWGRNPDGSGQNPPDFTAGKTFNLANRLGTYTQTADWTVGGILVIPGGSQLQIAGYTLSIADLTGTGSLSGTSASNLVVTQPSGGGTSLNFLATSNNLNNLTISSTTTTSLSSALNVYGVLTAQSGTFNTANMLTLKSTATNTARVAPVTGNISGSTTVERYIPSRRAWRIMGAPVGGSQTINSAWQEGVTTSSPNPNPNPGFGTHITEGSAADGLDHNPLIAMSSLKRYNSTSDTWMPVTNTFTSTVSSDAYMLFVRGDRGIPLGLNTVPSTSTTLRVTGPLRVGDQTFPVSGSGFTAVPNPFASPINFSSIVKSGVQNNFYVWDPKMGGEYGVGAYVLISYNGSGYDVVPAPVSPVSEYIQSGQGFLVQASTAGVPGTLTIREQDKSATPAQDVFRVTQGSRVEQPAAVQFTPAGSGQGLRVNLQAVNSDKSLAILDEAFTSYKEDYSDKLDNFDAFKAPNVEENLAIMRDGKNLMIDRRTLPRATNEVMQLKLWNTREKDYVLEFNPANLDGSGVSAVLEDKYLQRSTNISLSEKSQVYFSVNSDAASSATDRFKVVFNTTSQLPAFTDLKNSINTFPNPISGKTINLQLSDKPEGIYLVSLHDNSGRLVYEGRINHAGGSATKTIQLTNKLSVGTYHLVIVNQKTKVKASMHLLSK